MLTTHAIFIGIFDKIDTILKYNALQNFYRTIQGMNKKLPRTTCIALNTIEKRAKIKRTKMVPKKFHDQLF